MKLSFRIFTAGLFITLIFMVAPSIAKETPTLVKTFTLGANGNLEVQTSGGGITVEGHNSNQVEVQVFVKKKGKLLSSSDRDFGDMEDDLDLSIEKNGNTVSAIAQQRQNNRGWSGYSVSFRVLVPHRVGCDLRTSGGGITVADIQGMTKAQTSGGGITVKNQDGAMDLRTSGGGITVENADGEILGKTSGGSIRLSDIKGEVEVSTSGGSIDISGTSPYVKAGTSGGSIRVDVRNLSKGIHLKTSGGSISANIHGSNSLDLDLGANRVNIDLQNFSGTAKEGRVVGTMNGGNMPVYMHTSGGNVSVTY